MLKDLVKPCLIFVKAPFQDPKNEREQLLWCYFGGCVKQNSSCEQKHDEKPIAAVHSVIHLSESSLKHLKALLFCPSFPSILTYSHLPCRSHNNQNVSLSHLQYLGFASFGFKLSIVVPYSFSHCVYRRNMLRME